MVLCTEEQKTMQWQPLFLASRLDVGSELHFGAPDVDFRALAVDCWSLGGRFWRAWGRFEEPWELILEPRGSILEVAGSIAGALGSLLEAWGQKATAPPRSATPQRAKTMKNNLFFKVFRGSRVRGLWKIDAPRAGCECPRSSYFGRIVGPGKGEGGG